MLRCVSIYHHTVSINAFFSVTIWVISSLLSMIFWFFLNTFWEIKFQKLSRASLLELNQILRYFSIKRFSHFHPIKSMRILREEEVFLRDATNSKLSN